MTMSIEGNEAVFKSGILLGIMIGGVISIILTLFLAHSHYRRKQLLNHIKLLETLRVVLWYSKSIHWRKCGERDVPPAYVDKGKMARDFLEAHAQPGQLYKDIVNHE